MRCSHRHHPTRCGFTLVELLVVIGLIAVLIAILLPVLGRARNAAQTVACMSNLRQMGAALEMYRIHNSGFFPGLRNWTYANTILDPDAPVSAFDTPSADIGQGPYFWADSLLATKVVTKPLFRCPASGSHGGFVGPAWDILSENVSDYAMNEYLVEPDIGPAASGGTNHLWKPWRMNFRNRTEGLWIMDGLETSAYPLAASYWSPQGRLRHRGGRAVNILFFDLHVESRDVAPPGSGIERIIFDAPPYANYNVYTHPHSLNPTPLWRPWLEKFR